MAALINGLAHLVSLACVVDALPVGESFAAASRLLRTRSRQVMAMWLILVVVALGSGAVIVIPVCVVLGMGMPLASLATGVTEIEGWRSTVCLVLPMWAITTGFLTVLQTFSSSCWTLAYRQLTAADEEAVSAEEQAATAPDPAEPVPRGPAEDVEPS